MTNQSITPYTQFKNLIKRDDIQERFRQLLDDRASEFLGSLLTLVTADDKLLSCDPATIFAAAAKAAILRLPIAKELGYAWIVPFGRRAEFIAGYRGLVQLALRTSQYEIINATEIYEGMEIEQDPLTGVVRVSGERTGDEIISYASYFKLKNGFEKYLIMTVDEIHDHAKRYSASYGNQKSAWTTNFHEMAKKTVLRLNLSRWGLFSIEMVDADDKTPAIGDDPRLVVPDFSDVEPLEGQFEPEHQPEESTDAEPATNGNGNGERPYSPETLKERLATSAQWYDSRNMEATDRERKVLAKQLGTLFGGDDTKRYEASKYLTGTASTNEIPDGYVKAMLNKWLEVDDFDTPPNQHAMKEAKALTAAALKAEGQQELL